MSDRTEPAGPARPDLTILETIVARSYATLTAGTYTNRARDGTES